MFLSHNTVQCKRTSNEYTYQSIASELTKTLKTPNKSEPKLIFGLIRNLNHKVVLNYISSGL